MEEATISIELIIALIGGATGLIGTFISLLAYCRDRARLKVSLPFPYLNGIRTLDLPEPFCESSCQQIVVRFHNNGRLPVSLLYVTMEGKYTKMLPIDPSIDLSITDPTASPVVQKHVCIHVPATCSLPITFYPGEAKDISFVFFCSALPEDEKALTLHLNTTFKHFKFLASTEKVSYDTCEHYIQNCKNSHRPRL